MRGDGSIDIGHFEDGKLSRTGSAFRISEYGDFWVYNRTKSNRYDGQRRR